MSLHKHVLSLILVAATGSSVAAEPGSPEDWLDRMANAVQSLSYEGTVVRISNGEAESLKVAHTIVDGVVRERVVAQEGNGLEIVRNGNEVHCILPDRKIVRVEQWNDQSTLFSTLPTSDLSLGNEYDVVIRRKSRVAGREAMELAIRPHDPYRYGHRLWLDTETGFPLQTQLIGEDGEPLEQVKFAEISLDPALSPAALAPSLALDDFTWLSAPGKPGRKDVSTDWVAADLPAGFRVVSTEEEHLEDSGKRVVHILYSDGLASVSAFIVAADSEPAPRAALLGTSNSYSVQHDGYRITAMGQVPAATVERIAQSLTLR
ncbi:MAG: MucB/RseB C-terminal domain-containing protein [Woeseiaceae bacterium]|nr:MucB/RseB C-terminal domain-containing protein [Woeseiaceae bacterium]